MVWHTCPFALGLPCLAYHSGLFLHVIPSLSNLAHLARVVSFGKRLEVTAPSCMKCYALSDLLCLICPVMLCLNCHALSAVSCLSCFFYCITSLPVLYHLVCPVMPCLTSHAHSVMPVPSGLSCSTLPVLSCLSFAVMPYLFCHALPVLFCPVLLQLSCCTMTVLSCLAPVLSCHA